ncbi:solute carrier family 22 member 7-like [Neolamprologus brichardi]|uniref:solute carrier family 22 member 7-like n=1 Tax=Neolamprologus brichardi TaxID=32507 RepID=UPI0016439B70|nr:solute carrier family 22 member 7-like [Neolamprologus brichardi]
MKFETILEEIDGFGRFQIAILILLCTSRMVLPCHFLLNNFIAAVPPHHCDISTLEKSSEELFRNLTREQKLTVSLPVREDGEPKSCEMFAEPQFQLLSNSSNRTDLPTVWCQSGWVYDNSTFISTLATEWNLVCDKKSQTKTTNTIFFVGVMIGALAFGFFCDKYGRKTMLLVSYILSIVFGFSSTFANSYTLFAVLRFFTGFSLTGISVISIVLTYFHLVKTPRMRWLTFLLGIVWYGVASTYYGISLNITGFGLNMYLTHFIYGAIEVPAKLTIYCFLNIIGRRKCQSGTLLLTGICIGINIFIPKDLWHVRAIVATLGKGLSEASFTTIFLYTAELYPTVTRSVIHLLPIP